MTPQKIDCQYASCRTPATTGGLVTVQPNGMAPTHTTYYACPGHSEILADAVETWPVTTNGGAA